MLYATLSLLGLIVEVAVIGGFVYLVVQGYPKAAGRLLGLIPREESSGGRQKLGAITKQGNRMQRSLLEAALILRQLRHDSSRALSKSSPQRSFPAAS